MLVDISTFADIGTVKKVTSVKLNARLVRKDLHNATALFFRYPGSELNALAGGINYPVVIIAQAYLELLIILANPRPDLLWCEEIKRGSLYRGKFTEGNVGSISGNKLVCE